MHKIFRSLPAALLAVIVAMAAAPAAAECETGMQYVTARVLNVRNAPEDGVIVAQYLRGTQVTVLECRGGWARIGAREWVHSDFLAGERPGGSGG